MFLFFVLMVWIIIKIFLAFIFACLIVTFNLIADVLYGFLDPRIRYD